MHNVTHLVVVNLCDRQGAVEIGRIGTEDPTGACGLLRTRTIARARRAAFALVASAIATDRGALSGHARLACGTCRGATATVAWVSLRIHARSGAEQEARRAGVRCIAAALSVRARIATLATVVGAGLGVDTTVGTLGLTSRAVDGALAVGADFPRPARVVAAAAVVPVGGRFDTCVGADRVAGWANQATCAVRAGVSGATLVFTATAMGGVGRSVDAVAGAQSLPGSACAGVGVRCRILRLRWRACIPSRPADVMTRRAARVACRRGRSSAGGEAASAGTSP